MYDQSNSAKRIAMKDMSKHFEERIFHNEFGFVSPHRLDTKRIRGLNKLLGIHNINFFGNINGKKQNT